MTSNQRHQHMEATRVRAELTVQDLWLRYVALGGSGDAFDLDGYLQGLVPLETFQQDVLAQALNEALDDSSRAHFVPLSSQPSGGTGDAEDDGLRRFVEDLLGDRPPAGRQEDEQPGTGPP
jgi:hypothetical protein